MTHKGSIRSIPGLYFVLIIILLAAACGRQESQPSGRGGGAAVSVEAMVIRPQPIENKILTTGTLMANEEVELRAEFSGRVTGVFFEEGKNVRRGDLLLKINDRDLQAQFKRKQLAETLAANEEQRQRSLYEMNGISREEYDKVLTSLNMIKAEREEIESQLAKTEITAPFDGVIGLRYVSEGSYVSPATQVASMQDIDPIKVEFSVPEKYAGRINTGTGVKVSFSEFKGEYRGAVYAVEAKVDAATRTLKVRATIPNKDGRLIPGSFARVDITLERIPDAIVIPTGAILPELGGERVFVYSNGLARSVPVTTGIRAERSIQITQGLKPNDTLIVTGLMQITDGRPVQITGFAAE